MEVKFHFGLQHDKNDPQKVDDRLLFYAPENSKDQIEPPLPAPHPRWMDDTNFP